MSALLPKADIRVTYRHVCFGPKAEMGNTMRFRPYSDSFVVDRLDGLRAFTSNGYGRIAAESGRAEDRPKSQ